MMGMFKGLLMGMMMVVMVSLIGCCGGETTVKTQTTATTLGDELKSLKDAYDQGIITEQQYETSKEQLIKQRTKTK